MTRRGRQVLAGVLVLVGVQAGAVLVYMGGRRSADVAPSKPSLATVPVEPRQAPELALTRSDGSRTSLRELQGKPVLVHFWATWCAPCRVELPGLLAAMSEPLELLAVSVDDDWDQIRMFFDGRIPRSVMRPEVQEVHRRFGASTLPDSYLVDAAGRIVQRYSGAQDWSTREARAALMIAVQQAAQP